MAGKLSTAGDDVAIKAVLGIAPSAGRYLALCTTAPTDSAVGAELTGVGTNGYTRQLTAFGAPATVSGAEVCGNSAAVVFGPFTAAGLGTVTHVMLMDDAALYTAAHMLAYAQLDTARTPGDGDMIQFAPGDLTWSND